MPNASVYRRLQKHLDRMPVGYPRTLSGVELSLLRDIFTEEDAAVALGMDERYRTASEILERLGTTAGNGPEAADLSARLETMVSRGAVGRRNADREARYALVPFIVGMYELQLPRISPSFMARAGRYAVEGYALEFLSGKTRQSRVIPIEESVREKPRIASYDRLESIIREAGERIAIVECICRIGRDRAGEPCTHTDRRELCMVFRDFADTVVHEGWGRGIGTEEALEIARLNEKEGLVLQTSNEQEPQFICACCGDCCGLLAFVKFLPKPADFVASPYRAVIAADRCSGCGRCIGRCHMDAVSFSPVGNRSSAIIDPDRCIGCGACVPSCSRGAIVLGEKGSPAPPADNDALMQALAAGRRRGWGKTGLVVRVLLDLVGKRLTGPSGRSRHRPPRRSSSGPKPRG